MQADDTVYDTCDLLFIFQCYVSLNSPSVVPVLHCFDWLEELMLGVQLNMS